MVPFRMTRQMVDGMGFSGTEGVFMRCAEETMRVLRERSEVIMTVLDVFRYDPLHKWFAGLYFVVVVRQLILFVFRVTSGEKLRKLQPETTKDRVDKLGAAGAILIDMDSDLADEQADRALSSVERKLSKSLSVTTAVRSLVSEAIDPENLSRIYHGT
jgi:serine-protein kinase ATM